MIIQRVLKGINHPLSEREAREILEVQGILSNWWLQKGSITPPEVIDQLTEARLMAHLNSYEAVGAKSPFISTTSGSIVRDVRGWQNRRFTADYVATRFATDDFREPGWIFSGYVFALGRKTIEQRGFSEEVRELHTYTGFLPYQPEGEIVAKIHIPAVQLEEAWEVKPGAPPSPSRTPYPRRGVTLRNEACFVDPADLVNLREVL